MSVCFSSTGALAAGEAQNMLNVETAAAAQKPRRLTVPRKERLEVSGFIGFLMLRHHLRPFRLCTDHKPALTSNLHHLGRAGCGTERLGIDNARGIFARARLCYI